MKETKGVLRIRKKKAVKEKKKFFFSRFLYGYDVLLLQTVCNWVVLV